MVLQRPHSRIYGFTGREYETNTGLYYYRARYYNPAIGRFLQVDPIGYYDSLNPYQYCGNNPVNWTDPWGESWWDGMRNWGQNTPSRRQASDAMDFADEAMGGSPAGPAADNSAAAYPDTDTGEADDSEEDDDATGASDKETASAEAGSPPPNYSPPGSGRRGAYRQAKRDSGTPNSRQPDSQEYTKEYNKDGTVKEVHRVYYFTTDPAAPTIRYDSCHKQNDPVHNRGRHFNVDGSDRHYDF